MRGPVHVDISAGDPPDDMLEDVFDALSWFDFLTDGVHTDANASSAPPSGGTNQNLHVGGGRNLDARILSREFVTDLPAGSATCCLHEANMGMPSQAHHHTSTGQEKRCWDPYPDAHGSHGLPVTTVLWGERTECTCKVNMSKHEDSRQSCGEAALEIVTCWRGVHALLDELETKFGSKTGSPNSLPLLHTGNATSGSRSSKCEVNPGCNRKEQLHLVILPNCGQVQVTLPSHGQASSEMCSHAHLEHLRCLRSRSEKSCLSASSSSRSGGRDSVFIRPRARLPGRCKLAGEACQRSQMHSRQNCSLTLREACWPCCPMCGYKGIANSCSEDPSRCAADTSKPPFDYTNWASNRGNTAACAKGLKFEDVRAVYLGHVGYQLN